MALSKVSNFFHHAFGLNFLFLDGILELHYFIFEFPNLEFRFELAFLCGFYLGFFLLFHLHSSILTCLSFLSSSAWRPLSYLISYSKILYKAELFICSSVRTCLLSPRSQRWGFSREKSGESSRRGWPLGFLRFMCAEAWPLIFWHSMCSGLLAGILGESLITFLRSCLLL